MTNEFSVARFLSGLFPKVTEIKTDLEYEDNDCCLGFRQFVRKEGYWLGRR